MRMKRYKEGDRVFYECHDGKIGSAVVLKVFEQQYIENDNTIKFQWLQLGKNTGIENYNCLSPTNPKVKEFVKKYKEFDKKKEGIIGKILELVSPFDQQIQEEIIVSVSSKLGLID